MKLFRFLFVLPVLCGIVSPTFAKTMKPTIEQTWSAHPPHHYAQASSTSPVGYAPTQIRHAYGIDSLPATGKGHSIAIVDAYDDPTVAADLLTYTQTFKLPLLNGLPGQPSCTIKSGPHPCFEKIYSGPKPKTNAGWALETALDSQWAHAIAPQADLLLIEAPNASLSNLFSAIDLANSFSPTVVSMSWGGPEFSTEQHYDQHFKPGILYTASSGDSGSGSSYPAASPTVLGIGGTHLELDAKGNRLKAESAWKGSGGGISTYEPQPDYQDILGVSSAKRSTPDVSFDADPTTGFAVYSTTGSSKAGWVEVGGTSAGAPEWAALLTLTKTPLSIRTIYQQAGSKEYLQDFWDIASGKNGSCGSICTAKKRYDLVTGLGSPKAEGLFF